MTAKYYQFSEVHAAAFYAAALEHYDFQTCQRGDGSYYGTGGQCRKGTPAEKPEKDDKKESRQEKANRYKAAAAPFRKGQNELDSSYEAIDAANEKFGEGSKQEQAAIKKAGDKWNANVKQAEKVTELAREVDEKNRLAADDKKIDALYKKANKAAAKGDIDKTVEIADDIESAKKARGDKAAKLLESAAKNEEKLDRTEKRAVVESARAEVKNVKDQVGKQTGKESLEAQQKRAAGEPPEYGNQTRYPQYTKAAELYTKGNNAQTMNNCARRGDCSPTMQKKMKDFDGLLKELPANESGASHFRGMTLPKDQRDQLASLKRGDTIKDNGYSSYSRDPNIAGGFARSHTNGLGGGGDNRTQWPVVIESRSTSLKNIENMSVFGNEKEAVLPRGTNQKVTDVVTVDGVVFVYTE